MDDVEMLALIIASGRVTGRKSESVARKILEVGFVRLPDVDTLAEIIARGDPGAQTYKIARRIIETLT